MTNNREIKFRGFHKSGNGKEKVYVNGEWIKGFWVYGYLFHDNIIIPPAQFFSYGKCKLEEYDALWLNNNIEFYFVIPETVGQYTGLKDKNGKEIYKGDIVEFFGMKGRIVKECGAYGIETSKQINYDVLENEVPFNNAPMFCYNDNFISLWELWWNYEQDDNPLYEVEVVGNIYENPELLEVK